jgi:hypothetical protein
LRKFIVVDGILESRGDVLLTNHLIEPRGSVFSRRDNKIFHPLQDMF